MTSVLINPCKSLSNSASLQNNHDESKSADRVMSQSSFYRAWRDAIGLGSVSHLDSKVDKYASLNENVNVMMTDRVNQKQSPG